jgi:hypothetical protein
MSVLPILQSEKPPLPTLWLDTAVVIKLTKIARGEALDAVEVTRCTHLQQLVFKLGRAGKLLCPQSDQEEEYAARRLDDDVQGMFARLSRGVSLSHRYEIFDQHVVRGMEAFVRNAETICLPVSFYFHGDPIRRLEEARHERFVVSVGPLKSPEIVRRRAKAKATVGRQWESLRKELVAKGQTFRDQLLVEEKGEVSSIRQNLQKFMADLFSGKPDFWNFMAASGPLRYRDYWNQIGGKPPDWEGVFKFFYSPYFTQLPLPFIQTHLIAELLTGNEPVRPSDPMDIDLLAVALPVSHFVLTDRRMEVRIKKLKLDVRFDADVYSMATIAGLFERLQKV